MRSLTRSALSLHYSAIIFDNYSTMANRQEEEKVEKKPQVYETRLKVRSLRIQNNRTQPEGARARGREGARARGHEGAHT